MAGKIEKTALIKVYVKPEEKEVLKAKAKSLNLSLSVFFRMAALNLSLPNFEKQKAVQDLLKINADLARLGNLLKLAIDEGTSSEEDLNQLIGEVAETQSRLKEKIKTL